MPIQLYLISIHLWTHLWFLSSKCESFLLLFSVFLSFCLFFFLSFFPSFFLTFSLSFLLTFFLSFFPSYLLSFCLSFFPFFFPSYFLSFLHTFCLSICLSFFPSFFLSFYCLHISTRVHFFSPVIPLATFHLVAIYLKRYSPSLTLLKYGFHLLLTIEFTNYLSAASYKNKLRQVNPCSSSITLHTKLNSML